MLMTFNMVALSCSSIGLALRCCISHSFPLLIWVFGEYLPSQFVDGWQSGHLARVPINALSRPVLPIR